MDTIETLLSTLGLKCFQSLENGKGTSGSIFVCSDKYGSAVRVNIRKRGSFCIKDPFAKWNCIKGRIKYLSVMKCFVQDCSSDIMTVMSCKKISFFLLFPPPLPSYSDAVPTVGSNGKIKKAKLWMLWKESILEKRERIFKGLIETDEFRPFEIYAHISINFIQNIFTGLIVK